MSRVESPRAVHLGDQTLEHVLLGRGGQKPQEAGLKGLWGLADLRDLDGNPARHGREGLRLVAMAVPRDAARAAAVMVPPQEGRHFVLQEFLDHALGAEPEHGGQNRRGPVAALEPQLLDLLLNPLGGWYLVHTGV